MADTLYSIRSFPLFSGLSEADGELLQSLTHLRRYPAGTRIFDEGEPARGFYLVVRGTVKVFKVSPRGNEQVMAVITAGQTFAEAAVFLGGGYPASAECLEDCEMFFVEREVLLGIVARDPDFSLRMMSGMALKLRKFLAMVEDLTLRDARGRVARYLLGLTPQDGTPQCVVKLPTQQTVLARLLGLTSETLSRSLKGLRQEGVLGASQAGQMQILSVPALKDLTGEYE